MHMVESEFELFYILSIEKEGSINKAFSVLKVLCLCLEAGVVLVNGMYGLLGR